MTRVEAAGDERPRADTIPEDVEARAASKVASAEGARWITLATSEHLAASALQQDPRTGGFIIGALSEVLARIRAALARGRRPLPKDQLQRLVDLALEPLERVVAAPHVRVVRRHVLQPLSRVRTLDQRSMAWLARQSGRTVREKLGVRGRALAMVRAPAVDIAENRAVHALAARLAPLLERRLAVLDSYDTDQTERGERARLEEALALTTTRLARSELSGARPEPPSSPNNALLAHPDYSRLWRAWRTLRTLDQALARGWRTVEQRARAALFWAIAAELAGEPSVRVVEALCRRGRGGLELGAAGAWTSALTVRMVFTEREPDGSAGRPHTRPRDRAPLRERSAIELELRLDGTTLTLATHDLLGGGGRTRQSFDVRVGTALLPRRGLPIELAARGARFVASATIDVEGLRRLAKTFGAAALEELGEAREGQRTDARGVPRGRLAVGLDLAGGRARVATEDGVAAASCWTAATSLQVPSEHDATDAYAPASLGADERAGEWLAGHDRALVPVDVTSRTHALGDAVESGGHARGDAAAALSRVSTALAAELSVAAGARVAYALRDDASELTARTMHLGVSAGFGAAEVEPIWRSVAAALGWAIEPGRRELAEPDVVLVVDGTTPELTLTPLRVERSRAVQSSLGERFGFVLERRPPAPADEATEQLGLEHLIRELLDGEPLDLGDALLEALVRTGVGEALLVDDKPQLLACRGGIHILLPNAARRDEVLQRAARRWGAATAGWLGSRNAKTGGDSVLGDMLRPLSRGRIDVLLVGGAFAHERFAGAVKRHLRDGLGELGFRVIEGHVLRTERGAIARGALHHIERRAQALPTWKEWLPGLAIEVVRDGRYEELELLGAGAIEATAGQVMEHEVTDLLLPAGRSSYRLPVALGRERKRLLEREVVLRSPAFPLAAPTPVRLRVTYRHGTEDGYALSVTPSDGAFATIEGEWEDAELEADPHTLALLEEPRPLIASEAAPTLGVDWRFQGDGARWLMQRLVAVDLARLAGWIRGIQRDVEGQASVCTDAQFEMLGRSAIVAPLLELAVDDVRVGDVELPRGAPNLDRCRDRALFTLATLGNAAPLRLWEHVHAIVRAERTSPRGRGPFVRALGLGLRRELHDEHLDAIWALAREPMLAFEDLPAFNGLLASLAVVLAHPSGLDALHERAPEAERRVLALIERELDRLSYRTARLHAASARRETERDGREEAEGRLAGLRGPFEDCLEILAHLFGAGVVDREALGVRRVRALARHVRLVDGRISAAERERPARRPTIGAVDAGSLPAELARVSPRAHQVDVLLRGRGTEPRLMHVARPREPVQDR